jgi:hypothetical protein
VVRITPAKEQDQPRTAGATTPAVDALATVGFEAN